jgi:hypothetical protein
MPPAGKTEIPAAALRGAAPKTAVLHGAPDAQPAGRKPGQELHGKVVAAHKQRTQDSKGETEQQEYQSGAGEHLSD